MSKITQTIATSLIILAIVTLTANGQTRVGKLGLGAEGCMQYILGAGSVKSSAGFGGGLNMSYSLLQGLSIRAKFVVNQLVWKNSSNKSITTDFVALNGYCSADFLPNGSFNPFIFAGAGLVFYDPKTPEGSRQPTSSFDLNYMGGAGVDIFPNEFWSIGLMAEYVMTYSPYYNGPADTKNDSYMRGSIQIRYYFFDQLFVTKLLDKQREKLRGK